MSLAGQAPTVPHLGGFPRLYLDSTQLCCTRCSHHSSKNLGLLLRKTVSKQRFQKPELGKPCVCSGPQGVGGKEQERWGAGCVWVKGKTRKGRWRGRRGSGTR